MNDNTNSDRRMFKKLTAQNWRRRDPKIDLFSRYHRGRERKIGNDELAKLILETELSDSVPEDIRSLFEVAQGVHCYGCYYYPLYMLGSEQLYRVLEAALSHKWPDLGGPGKIKKFESRIIWLGNRGFLSEDRQVHWHAARKLRNIGSHPTRQKMIDPTMGVRGVRRAAELIEELFALKRPDAEENNGDDTQS